MIFNYFWEEIRAYNHICLKMIPHPLVSHEGLNLNQSAAAWLRADLYTGPTAATNAVDMLPWSIHKIPSR
jgi:hypothetical protein